MLASRAVSRSLSQIRHDTLKIQRAGFRVSPSARFRTRSATNLGRLWYRSDGTPRSRLTGLVVASISSAALYTMYSMLSLMVEYEAANYMLNCLIHIQRADSDYPSVDITSPESTLLHFRELCAAFGDIPQHMIDEFFDDLNALSGTAKEEAHRVSSGACQGVHDLLVQSKGKDTWQTTVEVIRMLDEAIMNLVQMVDQMAEEEEDKAGGGKAVRNQRIKEQIAKDPASRSSDYEVLG